MPEDGSAAAGGARLPICPEMVAVRKKVLDLCKRHNVMFLNAGNTDPDSSDNVIKQLKDGAMVIEGSEEAAIQGREFTKRKMPV